MKEIEKIINFINNGYSTFVSENANELFPYAKKSFPNYKESLQEACKNGKNLVFVSLLYVDKKITPYITISNEYTISDHRFPGARSFNYECITIFLHFNAENFEIEINEFIKTLSNYSFIH